MALVQTTKGLIDREQLEIKHVFRDTDNSHDIATEWFHDGELVRRDVTISILRGAESVSEQGGIS